MMAARSIQWGGVVGILAAAWLGQPAEATACEPPCLSVAAHPAHGATVPASFGGLWMRGFEAEETPQLFRLDGQEQEVALAQRQEGGLWFFAPETPLQPGAYALRARNFAPRCLQEQSPSFDFTVTAALPLPHALGTAAVVASGREKLTVSTSAGSCYESVDAAWVRVEPQIDASLAPYLDAALWSYTVDGTEFSMRTEVGEVPSARVLTACEPTTASGRVSAGVRTIVLRARLLGTGGDWSSPPLHVRLSCDQDHGEVLDAPPANGGTAAGSSGGGLAGGNDAPGEAESTAAQDGALAGGCQMGGSVGAHLAWAPLAWLALVAQRARRGAGRSAR